MQHLCKALKSHQNLGGILVTSLEQLESLDKEPIAKNLPVLSVAVLGMDKIMAVSPETYCDPVEACDAKAAEVTFSLKVWGWTVVFFKRIVIFVDLHF